MRIMIKGGVWKNTEDEILKAAVMKYGLNQWARISSLLTRKSAKQCKARWYEWLDPAIKKTEWTKEEDEKLLHLAKLFPTQWRTISPIVGRTPAQCLERYEKLLDLALSKDDTYDPSDDPRRLRPGEIDPNPEAKPARPDPVDMDEDEKEMLSEARARLANTRGKKAKRKAREKQLEEARRLAVLQKKRELRAAGIEIRGRERKKRGIDYNQEIPFEKKPLPGFYDTTEEQRITSEVKHEFRPVTLQELEGKRRKDIEEALMKQDIKKHKLLEAHNQPLALAKVSELNDPIKIKRRSKLMLPAPQVSDEELLQISKYGNSSAIRDSINSGAGGEVTRKLLGHYDATPGTLATPLRTPRTPMVSGGDRVLQEAHNQAKMREVGTPLLGEANPVLFNYSNPGSSDLDKSQLIKYPNSSKIQNSATPQFGTLRQGTELKTPLRDELGLNEPFSASTSQGIITKKDEKAHKIFLRNQLKAQLSQLPEPQNSVEVLVTPLPVEEEEEEKKEEIVIDPDAGDIDKEIEKLEEEIEKRRLNKRSQVIQRELPRPMTLVIENKMKMENDWQGNIENIIELEMKKMIEHDSEAFPLDPKKKKSKKKKKRDRMSEILKNYEDYEEEEIEVASKMIKEEMEEIKKEDGNENKPMKEYVNIIEKIENEIDWIPSKNEYNQIKLSNHNDKLEVLKQKFHAVRSVMEKEAKKAQKLEQKAKILCTGYWNKEEKIKNELENIWNDLQQDLVDLESYKELLRRETFYAPVRVKEMRAMVEVQVELEKTLQKRYQRLLDKKEDLTQKIESGVKAIMDKCK